MIKNTHPDFEVLLHHGNATKSGELVRLVEAAGLGFSESSDQLHLDEKLVPLTVEQIRAVANRYIDEELLPEITIYRSVDSTNDEALAALRQPGTGHYLMLAEMQTAGKGRRGRHWVSPFGRNVYLSYCRFLQRPLSDIGGLSLIAGMQAVEVLRQLGVEEVGLKWPNDLLFEGGKLGGILVELKPAEARGIGIVVGIGINLSMSGADVSAIDQAWSHVGNRVIDRNELIGRLLAGLSASIDHFDRHGFSAFKTAWQEYNLTAGQPIRIIRGEEAFIGIDRGIDEIGNLLLEREDGTLESHNSGEVSMRPLT